MIFLALLLWPLVALAKSTTNRNNDTQNAAHEQSASLNPSSNDSNISPSASEVPKSVRPEPERPRTSGTPLRASTTISEEDLGQYLASHQSPLAPYANVIVSSPFASTIIGICTIEQYSCSRLPGGTNWNLWGLMKVGGGLQFFATAEEGIAAIDAYLARRESQGRTTIESFRGFYCVNRNYPGNVCPNWESVVLKVKAEVESL